MGIITLILMLILGVSLMSLIYFGIKYTMSDGVTPDNAERVEKGVRISSILVVSSSVFLLLFYLF